MAWCDKSTTTVTISLLVIFLVGGACVAFLGNMLDAALIALGLE
jgi:hypothetical protein